MDNHLTIYWIILSLVLSTKGTIRITSFIVSPNTFNITCQWTGYATNVIFLRQTQTSEYPSAGGMQSRFNSVLQIKKPAFDCQVQSSLPVACICMKDPAVSCIINVTLEEHRIDQWQCGTLINGEMTFSNITTLTTKEPAKITTFQVDAFEGVSNVTLIENTTAMLTCIAEGYPLPEISLSKDDTLAFGETNVQSESSIRSQINQTFTNVNRRMSGKYTCVASNINGQSVHSLYLNILYPPSVIRTDNVYIKEGDRLNILCKYEPGYPSETALQWKKEGIIYANGILLYQKIARTDAGIYTCIATNTYENGKINFTGVDSKQFILQVFYQPIVQRFSLEQFDDNLNVTVSENDSVVFHCVAEGFPSPDMRLLKDTVTLAECNGNGQGNTTTLLRHELTSVGRQDMGKYICFASNTIGLGGQEMFLNVLIPVGRKITIQDFSNNGNEANIYVGGEVTFSFSALANPLPTSADFTWSKCSDNNICTEIANSSRVRIDTYKEMSNLTVTNITESDYGIYILKVGNEIGKSHTEVFLLKRLYVGFPLYIHAASNYNDAIVQPPSLLVDLLDIDCDTIVPSSSLAAEHLDFQSEIYSEIDPRLVSEIPFTDDGATNEAQPVTEPSRYENLDPPEQDDESQYIYGRCGR